MKKVYSIFLLVILLLTGCDFNINVNVGLSDSEIADKLIEEVSKINVPTSVTNDFSVPTTVSYEDYTVDITWTGYFDDLVYNNGTFTVDRGSSDIEADIKASISYEDEIREHVFNITILKLEPVIDDNPDPDTPTEGLPSELTYTGYYADLTGNFDNFFNVMNDILVSTHTTKLTYSQVWTVLAESDAYNDTYVECLYTGRLISKTSRDGSGNSDNGVVWNREHIWAKSHGFDDEKYTAYADAHHLRATEKNINSTRNNSYFAEVENPTGSDSYGNKWTGEVFEPRDEVKGDVARMLFYMVTRYHDSTLTLTLDNGEHIDSSTNNYPNNSTDGIGYLGLLSTLIKWHYEDPVSDAEIKRNEVVYTYQGNRNPYIDHPEFVYYLYTEESIAYGITEENVLEKVASKDSDEDTIIDDLINDINEIKDLVVTESDEATINSLLNRYNVLSSNDKLKVTNYNILEQKYNELLALKGVVINKVVYDLHGNVPSTGTSFGKTITATIDNVVFNISNYSTRESVFRLGSNTNNYVAPDAKYNAGNWAKFSIMEFIVDDLTEISFDVGTINTGFDGGYLLYSSDGITYEIIDEISIVEGENTFYSFSEAKSGYFVIAVVGSQPRVVISNFTLTYSS